MQHDTTDDLYREVLHTKHSPCSLTAGSKCIRQDVVECFTVCKTFFELWSHVFEFFVRHLGVLFLQTQDLIANWIDSL